VRGYNRAEEDIMTDLLTGWVHGNTITLESPIPPLEGKRVVLRIEESAEDPDERLSAEVQARLWRDWAAAGPQGPIEDEGEPEFP
jgi:hypothetical protein